MLGTCKMRMILFLIFLLTFHLSLSDSFFTDYEEESFVSSMYNGLKSLGETLGGAAYDIIGKSHKLLAFAAYASKFLDSTIEEECIYKCPSGTTLIPNENHTRKPNGCGSMGFSLAQDNLPLPEMQDCCNLHDLCYDTCLEDKELCDKAFQRCLFHSCDQSLQLGKDFLSRKKCQVGAKLLYTTTITLGCLSYKEAQKVSCRCVADPSQRCNRGEL